MQQEHVRSLNQQRQEWKKTLGRAEEQHAAQERRNEAQYQRQLEATCRNVSACVEFSPSTITLASPRCTRHGMYGTYSIYFPHLGASRNRISRRKRVYCLLTDPILPQSWRTRNCWKWNHSGQDTWTR